MSSPRQIFGNYGEQLAAAYLQQKGYQFEAANWRCPHGELDLVLRLDEMVVFVEVKTRHNTSTAPAFVSITPRKRERLIASAHAYLTAHDLDEATWRIDAIAIAIPRKGQPIIDHVEDALDW
jgi:putative endonuclease